MWNVRPNTTGETDAAGRSAVKRTELTRRAFVQRSAGLGLAGLIPGVLGGAVGTLLSACSSVTEPAQMTTIDLKTEVGVLNFLYAVLQLESDFYTRVITAKYPGMLMSEFTTFGALRSSVTVARNDLMNTQIPTGRLTDVVLFRLGELVDYSDRTSVVPAAQIIADNAAGGFLAAKSLVHTAETVTLVTTIADAAALRAADIRTIAGAPPPTVTPLAPQTVMETLALYYYTTFTVLS